MNINRGDIWYVGSGYAVGSEQRPGRPAVVVSNQRNNQHSEVVEMVIRAGSFREVVSIAGEKVRCGATARSSR